MTEKSILDYFGSVDRPQRLYCGRCERLMHLDFVHFQERITGVRFDIEGIPALRCSCGNIEWPDRSKFAIVELHRKAMEKETDRVTSTRTKPNKEYAFSKVPFEYDSDDYENIPGLMRPWDDGFLTPVFFRRDALLKFEHHPNYEVKFASATYGTIYSSEPAFYISFGINENGLLVMWLGDIAKLPETEQYYLRSENVPSDHHIGSEFYEGQIEVKFTEEAPENRLFRLRSELNEASRSSLGFPVFQVSSEILDSAILVRDPIFDTKTSRAQVAQALNDVYVESLEASQLKKHLKAQDVDVSNIKGIKLLERLMITLGYSNDLRELMKPFYLIYDLRVAQSHLMTTDSRREKVNSVSARLGMDDKATFSDIYEKLRESLDEALTVMEATLKGRPSKEPLR
jgi:hypothetical protein